MPPRYIEQPTYRNVFGTCICHGRNTDGVELPVEIPGYQGLVFVCAETILESGPIVRIGRARRAKHDKAAKAADAKASAV